MLAMPIFFPTSKPEMQSSPSAGGQSDQSWQETKTGKKKKKIEKKGRIERNKYKRHVNRNQSN